MYIVTRDKDKFDVESQRLKREGVEFLSWQDDAEITVYNVYNLANIDEEEIKDIAEKVFDRKKSDITFALPDIDEERSFRYRQVTGQYNQRQQMLEDIINNVLGYEGVKVDHSKIVEIHGVDQDEIERFKDHLLNPVENVEIPFYAEPAKIKDSDTSDLEPIEGFIDMTEEEINDLTSSFSMDLEDLLLCQDYFKEEGRNPNLSELQVIDTYWSDHCRHTTFNTSIEEIDIEEGPYKELFEKALEDYLNKRKELERENKPISLMDMGTIQAKYLREKDILTNVELSSEVNACALEIKVDVDGEEEDWILYFKNETHNHPTEIEPYGGASTCVGGGIRDPLSGRSWVYQAMRISGAKDPTLEYDETHPDKLPQRTISKEALRGNSDYANEIGITGAYAEEIYHPGFEAKRLEVGALIAAAPRENVVREEPVDGDKIILLGGKTGRDGVGAAVGSSQVQTEESLENAGAEVQKGAPSVERKIMRLFRNGQATRLIKKCNDFGAGGVSVAVGELADGLEIDLDKVPLKYPGLNGGEIALSESQERMAVVVADKDMEEFLSYAEDEDVEYSVIATVTDDKRMKMFWQGKTIIDLSREFLDSNGCQKYSKAKLVQPENLFDNGLGDLDLSQEGLVDYMTELNRADQKSMAEQFDASVGRATLLYPYGGKNRTTKEEGMVSYLPVDGKTSTISAMAYGYNPYLSSQSPFHGGYYAVIQSVSKMVAMGLDYRDIRLTFQEYFESLKDDPVKWGKPVLALLGANEAMDGLDIASIGGKDSMSGTYEDINVPPTLISFAVAQGKSDYVLSRAFKEEGSKVVLIENKLNDENVIDLELQKRIYERIYNLAEDKKILAASTVGFDGLLLELIEMSYGNDLGFTLEEETDLLTRPMMGAFILEIGQGEELEDLFYDLPYKQIGQTSKTTRLADIEIDLQEISEKSKEVFDTVFNLVESEEKGNPGTFDQAFTGSKATASPKALIPVLLGTSGEYDLDASLKDAGFETKALVIKDSTNEKFEESLKIFIEELKSSQLLALPSGAVFGSEPNNQGRAWEIILNRDDVREAVNKHLEDKNLILGIGSSFAALIRTGLIEHGEITGDSSIRILANENGKFISDIYTGKVISNNSAFTKDLLGEEYTAPMATAYGRIDLGAAGEKMENQGQILSVFTSFYANEYIDALTSPNGLVLGTISAIDRVSEDLYKNIGGVKAAKFLDQAREYFN